MSIKLSETQHAAIVEVSELGYTVAKANTIKSLETKGLIEPTSNTHHKLTQAGREYLGLPSEEVSEESIESLLGGDPWKIGDAITADEADLEFDEKYGVDPETGTKDAPLAGWELKVMAENSDQFEGDVLVMIEEYKRTVQGWKGTEVWDGLSLEEIKEDIATAYPVGRQARRVHHRTLRNAFRRMAVAASPESRKSIKITGKVGV